MSKLEQLAKQLKNKKAKEWRDKNKDKIREINKRYWLKQAKKELEKEENRYGKQNNI